MFGLAQKLTPILSRLRTIRGIKSAAAPAFGTRSISYLSHRETANEANSSISSLSPSHLPSKNVLSGPFLGFAVRSTAVGNANSLLEMNNKLQVRGFATDKVNFQLKIG